MPGRSVKKIDIDQVRPGMYLEDVFNDRGAFLLSANTSITSVEQVIKLKQQGIRSVFINTELGTDLPAPAGTDQSPKPRNFEAEYFRELPQARAVRQRTTEITRDALTSVRKGRSINPDKIEAAAQEIADSILRNPDTLVSLCQIKGRDDYTLTHSVNVGVLVASLTHSMGYGCDQLLAAGMGGLLHDIGKMRVPDSILNKPGKYADWEFEVMKKHPLHGLDVVKDLRAVPAQARTIIAQHHERFNGTGYPLRLKGNQISELGLVSAVADVYDALTSDRIYRAAWTPQKALALIFQGCDEAYSRGIVERFTKHLGVYPVGSFVRLESGEMGIVTRIGQGRLLAPQLLVLFDKEGQRLDAPVEYDLWRMQREVDAQLYKIVISLNPKAYRVEVAGYLDKQGEYV